jgi:hypothetical protein
MGGSAGDNQLRLRHREKWPAAHDRHRHLFSNSPSQCGVDVSREVDGDDVKPKRLRG